MVAWYQGERSGILCLGVSASIRGGGGVLCQSRSGGRKGGRGIIIFRGELDTPVKLWPIIFRKITNGTFH